MTTVSRRSLSAAVLLACLTTSSFALSGDKISIPVSISGSTASGQIGSARASSDGAQYIGCTDYGTYGWCFAEDVHYSALSCYWSTSAQAAAVGGITPMSYITFSADANGNCTSLHVSTFSYYLPPTP